MPTLEKAGPIYHVADVVFSGSQLLIPEGMAIPDAITLLRRRMEYDNESTEFSSTFDCFPWDGAFALFNVLRRRYGWASMETVYTFFGPKKPTLMEVEVGYGKIDHVPWGRLSLFKEEGYIDCETARKGARFVFKAKATVVRKHEKVVKDIFEEVRRELAKNSIYRGQAVSLRFRDDDGEPLPVPEAKFVDTSGASREGLIFSKIVQDAIDTNLFTPIERMEDCKRAGIPVKRGILLAGVFGVGKTLAAKVAAALAVRHDKTFIYCKKADEFPEAVEFASQYQPAILFCEDIDRVVTGERSAEMDQILNIIDGIDTKNSEIIVVLTTNSADKINPAILRPGRLDSVIEVTAPDEGAVIKLIKHYAGHFLDPDANLQEAAALLAGNIPAVIEEVVKRSKLAALKDTAPGSTDILITGPAIAESASTMGMQLRLLDPEKYKKSQANGATADAYIQQITDDLMDKVEYRTRKVVRKSLDERFGEQ